MLLGVVAAMFWIDCNFDSALFTAQVEVLLVVVELGGAIAHESVHLSSPVELAGPTPFCSCSVSLSVAQYR